MLRTATVKIGDVEAIFDGRTFTSADASVAAILNSSLEAYRAGVPLWEDTIYYWRDEFEHVATGVAQSCGGELIAVDPPQGKPAPEGAVY